MRSRLAGCMFCFMRRYESNPSAQFLRASAHSSSQSTSALKAHTVKQNIRDSLTVDRSPLKSFSIKVKNSFFYSSFSSVQAYIWASFVFSVMTIIVYFIEFETMMKDSKRTSSRTFFLSYAAFSVSSFFFSSFVSSPSYLTPWLSRISMSCSPKLTISSWQYIFTKSRSSFM